MKTNWQIKKQECFEIYKQAHNNAVDLLRESEILFKNQCYTRSYFLAHTALEEISKSQHVADVSTGFSTEKDFLESFMDHKEKINRAEWAYEDANEYPYNYKWVGPRKDDLKKILAQKPHWKKRQNSLYVDVTTGEVTSPRDKLTKDDAESIIHIVKTAMYRIFETAEYYGHQIGTKGFMK